MLFDSFDYDSYFESLKIFLSVNENLCFDEISHVHPGQRYFILRHDVDFDPGIALRMAQLEAERGIRSTYFILLTSPYYNLLIGENRRVPRQLVELGHKVGLHYDIIDLSLSGENQVLTEFKFQISILSELAGSEIKMICAHNPSLSSDDPFKRSDEFINAADSKFTTDITYLSDSCGAWRDEAIDIFKSGIIPERLQLLIHPFYWNDRPEDRWQIIENFQNESVRNIKDRIAYCKAVWSAHPGVKQHDRRKRIIRTKGNYHKNK